MWWLIIINVSYIMKVTKTSKKSGCPIKAKPDKCGSLDWSPHCVKFVQQQKHCNYDKQVSRDGEKCFNWNEKQLNKNWLHLTIEEEMLLSLDNFINVKCDTLLDIFKHKTWNSNVFSYLSLIGLIGLWIFNK